VSRQEIEFEGHGGVTLRGWLYLPDDLSSTVAAVAMAHGLSAVKEMALDRYAEVFAASGLAVLVYDHRNLGASDGERRQEINPWAQARDYRFALDWLATRPEVDPGRLGIWGSSFSGGEVLVVGACDDRVRAVVANVPFSGYAGVDYGDTASGFEAIRSALLDESGEGPADTRQAAMGPVPVVREEGADGPAILDQPESSEWFLAEGARCPTWRNQVTLVNMMGSEPGWDPGQCVAHIAPTPLLLVVAEEDRLAATEISRAAFERAGSPKELLLIPGHHFVPYSGEPFEKAAAAAARFFTRHLSA